MVGRHRVRNHLIVPAGAAQWLGPGFVNGSYVAQNGSDICDDVIDGTREPHPLTVIHTHNVQYRVFGRSNGNSGWNYNGTYKLGNYPTIPLSQAFPSDNSALSYGLSRMNPNRPDIDLPIFIWELKDIPQLVFRWGRILAKQFSKSGPSSPWALPVAVAEQNLEWQFAIKPFLNDMRKLLDFESAVQKRIERLQKMQQRGSIGGNIDVWDASDTVTVSNIFPTALYQESNRGDITYEATRRVWVTAKMTPLIQLPQNDDKAMERLARRLVFGRDISVSTIWEAMPWSWLIDWFGNVGDLLMIHRNSLPIQWSNSCIMKHTLYRINSWVHRTGPGVYTLQNPIVPQYESKTRAVWGSILPLPEFNLPFLNGKQLGILASLAVTGKVPRS